MKAKRFIALAVTAVMLLTGSAYSAQPEDALTVRPNESVYGVLKLSDTSGFLKWLFSEENIDIFMPLVIASENSNDIMGGIEMIRSVAQNTPLKSAVVIAGVTSEDIKKQEPFFQAAFTVSSEHNSIVRNLSEGRANAKDIAKLLLGKDSPLIPFAETMIKVERGNDNILRIDNAVFVKAVEDVILVGLSEEDVKLSVKALEDEKARLHAILSRAFKTQDFALIHVDPKTAEAFDANDELKDGDISGYCDKPVTVELGFEKLADKFTLSLHGNYLEAMSDKYRKKLKPVKAVKGGYIDLKNSGGASEPMLAMGGLFNLAGADELKESKEFLDEMFGQLKKRFGIEKKDVYALFNGPFSIIVNGSVMFESFKIPALYMSQTGEKGAASRVYSELTKSKYFHKVHDGILQVDSSLSPVSCIIGNAGDTLGVAFAELASFSDRPKTEGAFGSLMSQESIASLWLDFAGIQSWLNDDSNGVFAALTPIASIFGYGGLLELVRDILNADLSVRSMSFRAENHETFHFEFALKDVRPEDGFMSKMVKLYRELQ